jgi:ATP-dependent Clp protease ATP-binding subunit ClpC
MMGFSATDEVSAALARARTEAVELRHEYIGTEHILLGLVTPPSPLVAKLLATRNVDSSKVRESVEAIVRPGRATSRPDLPFTSSAKRILELALSAASELGGDAMNTGHLLLGVIREQKGIGAQALTAVGFTADALRDDYLALTANGHGEHRAAGPDVLTAPGKPHEMPPRAAVAALQIMLRSPRVAAVFERHHVDIQAIIRELSALPPES